MQRYRNFRVEPLVHKVHSFQRLVVRFARGVVRNGPLLLQDMRPFEWLFIVYQLFNLWIGPGCLFFLFLAFCKFGLGLGWDALGYSTKEAINTTE